MCDFDFSLVVVPYTTAYASPILVLRVICDSRVSRCVRERKPRCDGVHLEKKSHRFGPLSHVRLLASTFARSLLDLASCFPTPIIKRSCSSVHSKLKMRSPVASTSRLLLAHSARPARLLAAPEALRAVAFGVCASRAFAQSASARVASRQPEPSQAGENIKNARPEAAPRKMTHAERDAALREAMLERDGGPASVPTRGGNVSSTAGARLIA